MYRAGPLRTGFDSILSLEAGRRTIVYYLLLSFLRGRCSPSGIPEQMLLDRRSSGIYWTAMMLLLLRCRSIHRWIELLLDGSLPRRRHRIDVPSTSPAGFTTTLSSCRIGRWIQRRRRRWWWWWWLFTPYRSSGGWCPPRNLSVPGKDHAGQSTMLTFGSYR